MAWDSDERGDVPLEDSACAPQPEASEHVPEREALEKAILHRIDELNERELSALLAILRCFEVG